MSSYDEGRALAVIMLTYASGVDSPRHLYAKKTAEALYKNLRYSGDIRWHIAHDGSPEECIEEYLDIWEFATVTNSERNGYGASYNLATQFLHYDNNCFLVVEDDWELLRPFNLDPLVDALQDGLDCIRLGYLGWTQLLEGFLDKRAGHSYLVFNPISAEPHVWAGHPRLETREFQRKVGPWPEGVDPGTTEFIVASRKEAREWVAWPLDFGINTSQQCANLFAHIGAVTSRPEGT